MLKQQHAAAAQALAQAVASAHHTLISSVPYVFACGQLVLDDALMVFCSARAGRMAVGNARVRSG